MIPYLKVPKVSHWLQRRLLAATLFIGVLGLLLTPVSAAPITYQFVGTISGVGYGPDPVPFGGPRLVVTDTAVAEGNMAFQIGPGICPIQSCVVTGDPSGLVSFGYVITDFSGGNPPSGRGVLRLSVNFNPDGTLGGSIIEHGSNSDFDIGGDEFAWSGAFSADNSLCDAATLIGACTLSGYWFTEQALPIPEPASVWLLGGGLLTVLLLKAMGLFRRRKATLLCAGTV